MAQWNPIIVGLPKGTDIPTDNTSMRMTPPTNPGMPTTMTPGRATATPTA